MKPREFVRAHGLLYPRGGYTVAPVFSGSVLDMSFHVNRLYSSCLMLGAAAAERKEGIDCADFGSFSSNLSGEVRSSVRLDAADSGLLTMCAGREEVSGIYKLSALFTTMEKDALLCLGLPSLTVDVSRYTRMTPLAKAASWPMERMSIEERRNCDANETILVNADGVLLEGLTSNFFAMRGSVLHTAPKDKVLCGSMADLVVKVAQGLGIETTEEAPARIADLEQFDAAFLTSATKPIAPIRRVITSAGEVVRDFPTDKMPFALQLLLMTVRKGLAENLELLSVRKIWTHVDDL